MSRWRSTRHIATLNQILLLVGSAGVVLMMIHVVANAALRSAGSSALTGTNEFVEFWYMPVIAFLGFIVAMRERGHTEARVLFDWFPARSQLEVDAFTLVLTTAMCAGFAFYGFQDAWHNWNIGLTGGVSGVVIWPVTFLPAITFSVMALQALTQTVMLIRGRARFKDSEDVMPHDAI